MDISRKLTQSQDIATKVALLYGKRAKHAQQQFTERMQKAFDADVRPLLGKPLSPQELWSQWYEYAVDATQRSVLFWDTIRQRGNEFLEHARQGLPPVLHFDYEMVVDGRTLVRPVNYAMVRIVPPQGVTVDPLRRPYLIIDPRAGHGPGIGGFKDDSQVGVALREGHPVYFVIFFREPEPGQTLLDVCEAEKAFVKRVRELHPRSAKPAIVGNCQGGWAAMMLAAADPDETGPIVINGAPMSYWGGAWTAGEGDNPMRYSGGLLGGTWLASFMADMGHGIFDGAYLVENFESLNPANTFWDKYYNLYKRVDTEPPRFLEFERWWGGFYLMNREEIEWITRNLFVGNKLWTGGNGERGGTFDLRGIKAPIILFASMGDNITPPQQAFNWVADVYGSTEEIKARGQVIVGLLHEDVGHLGIFVSGKVATKEHAQIVSVMKSIEALPPGLYGMAITERKGRGGEVLYEVEFREQRLEDITKRLNRFERQDEKPFEAVAALSEFNQRAYELFAQPLVQAMSSEYTAKLARQLHPLRRQRWAFSDLNPWLGWLGPAAEAIKADRRPATKDNALAKVEGAVSETISASLDYYRATRDAMSEARFFQTYGNVFSLFVADKAGATRGMEPVADARELPFVKSALAAIEQGGFPEALARVGYLLALKGEPLLLSRLEFRRDMIEKHRDLLPGIGMDQWRRIRGEQEIIARYEPERAIATLPKLLADPADRERLRALMQALFADKGFVDRAQPNTAQLAMMETLGQALDVSGARVHAAQAKLVGKGRKPTAAKRKPAKRAPAKRKAVKR